MNLIQAVALLIGIPLFWIVAVYLTITEQRLFTLEQKRK